MLFAKFAEMAVVTGFKEQCCELNFINNELAERLALGPRMNNQEFVCVFAYDAVEFQYCSQAPPYPVDGGQGPPQ